MRFATDVAARNRCTALLLRPPLGVKHVRNHRVLALQARRSRKAADMRSAERTMTNMIISSNDTSWY